MGMPIWRTLSDQLKNSAVPGNAPAGAWNGTPNASAKTKVPKTVAQNPPQTNATRRFFQKSHGRFFQRRRSQIPYAIHSNPYPASPTMMPKKIGKAREK